MQQPRVRAAALAARGAAGAARALGAGPARARQDALAAAPRADSRRCSSCPPDGRTTLAIGGPGGRRLARQRSAGASRSPRRTRRFAVDGAHVQRRAREARHPARRASARPTPCCTPRFKRRPRCASRSCRCRRRRRSSRREAARAMHITRRRLELHDRLRRHPEPHPQRGARRAPRRRQADRARARRSRSTRRPASATPRRASSRRR